jgi:RNA polymerase sigma-70 factor, ECF subfamily
VLNSTEQNERRMELIVLTGVVMAASEIELMELVKNGDAAAFTEIDNKWRPVLMGQMMRRVGNAADAEDLVQRTMFRVWQKADMFDAKSGTFSAWICRMVNNVLIDNVRSNSRKIRGGGVRHESLESFELATQADFTEEIADNELRTNTVQVVREVIQSMPRPLRQAVNGYLTGKKIAAVGDTLALSKGTVSGRLRLARERMRDNERLMGVMGESQRAYPDVEFEAVESTEKKVQLELF